MHSVIRVTAAIFLVSSMVSAEEVSPNASLAEGRRFFDAGRYPQSIAVYKELLAASPSSPEAPVAAYFIGLSEERRNNRQGALVAYRDMIARYGGNSDLATASQRRIREVEADIKTNPAGKPVPQSEVIVPRPRPPIPVDGTRGHSPTPPTGCRKPNPQPPVPRKFPRDIPGPGPANAANGALWPLSDPRNSDVRFPDGPSVQDVWNPSGINSVDFGSMGSMNQGASVSTTPSGIGTASSSSSSGNSASTSRQVIDRSPEPRQEGSLSLEGMTQRSVKRPTPWGSTGSATSGQGDLETSEDPTSNAGQDYCPPDNPVSNSASIAIRMAASELGIVPMPSEGVSVDGNMTDPYLLQRNSAIRTPNVTSVLWSPPYAPSGSSGQDNPATDKPALTEGGRPVEVTARQAEPYNPQEQAVLLPITTDPSEMFKLPALPADVVGAGSVSNTFIGAQTTPRMTRPMPNDRERPDDSVRNSSASSTAGPNPNSTTVSGVSGVSGWTPALPPDAGSFTIAEPSMAPSQPVFSIATSVSPADDGLRGGTGLSSSRADAGSMAAKAANGDAKLPAPLYTVSVDGLRRSLNNEAGMASSSISAQRRGALSTSLDVSAGPNHGTRGGNSSDRNSASQAGPADASIQRASNFRKLSQDDKAIEEYQNALRIDPDNTIAKNNLADIYVDRGENLDTAVELLLGAIGSNPPDKGPYYSTLGWAYAKLGDYENAEKFLNESLKLGFTSNRLYRRGRLFAAMGMASKARADFDRALVYSEDMATSQMIRKALETVDSELPLQGTARSLR